ncbi:MAG: site-specific integrase [Microbacteriaceae bacterium]|nr:site-specific integrase [Microbacteriaceae bacterium]
MPLVYRAEELALGQSIGKKAGDLLFTAPRGGQISGPNLTRALGWGELTSHRIYELRHTAATRWIAAGVSITIVSAWLGHVDPAITLRIYAGYLEENSLAGLEQLRAAALLNTRPKPSTGNSPANQHGDGVGAMPAAKENLL